MHYLRGWKKSDLTYAGFEIDAKRGHKNLVKYAKLAETMFGQGICTYNLHTLACRGYQQELARGPASRETEYWLERAINELKHRVKMRAKCNPEAVLINDVFGTMALEKMKTNDINGLLKTIDELKKGECAAQLHAFIKSQKEL